MMSAVIIQQAVPAALMRSMGARASAGKALPYGTGH